MTVFRSTTLESLVVNLSFLSSFIDSSCAIKAFEIPRIVPCLTRKTTFYRAFYIVIISSFGNIQWSCNNDLMHGSLNTHSFLSRSHECYQNLLPKLCNRPFLLPNSVFTIFKIKFNFFLFFNVFIGAFHYLIIFLLIFQIYSFGF